MHKQTQRTNNSTTNTISIAKDSSRVHMRMIEVHDATTIKHRRQVVEYLDNQIHDANILKLVLRLKQQKQSTSCHTQN